MLVYNMSIFYVEKYILVCVYLNKMIRIKYHNQIRLNASNRRLQVLNLYGISFNITITTHINIKSNLQELHTILVVTMF